MALKVLAPCIYAPDGFDADIEGRTIAGGESLSGAQDLIRTDGGGRVVVELADPFLDEPEAALAWRAIAAYLDGGAQPIIVMICDARHQPTAGPVTVPHSDGAPFSDETEYSQSDSEVSIAADAALRATVLDLDITTMPRGFLGGEWLSIDHPIHRWRAYRIAEVLEQTATTARVSVRPPLREAVLAGTQVELAAPRCVMRLDGEMRSPSRLGFAESPGARFVEHFPGPGGY